MEKPAHDVLGGKIWRITMSNVDPVWLAGELLATKIIGPADLRRASNPREGAPDRLGELVQKVMGNGRPDVFQTFVSVLFKEDYVKWLGEELKGMVPPRLLSLQCSQLACLDSLQSVRA